MGNGNGRRGPSGRIKALTGGTKDATAIHFTLFAADIQCMALIR